MVKEKTFWRLVYLLERPDPNENADETADGTNNISERATRAWAVLEGLSSSPSIVNCILNTSAWLELFGVLVGYVDFTKRWSARIGAAKTLSRLLWDPSMGSYAGRSGS